MMTVCPCCNRRLPAAKRAATPATSDTSRLSDDALYAHYKATAPREDVAFLLRAQMSDELRADVWTLYSDVLSRSMKRAEVYRRLTALQDRWRRESNARELRAKAVAAARLARRLARARARTPAPAIEDTRHAA